MWICSKVAYFSISLVLVVVLGRVCECVEEAEGVSLCLYVTSVASAPPIITGHYWISLSGVLG